jgi:hypothetical protein
VSLSVEQPDPERQTVEEPWLAVLRAPRFCSPRATALLGKLLADPGTRRSELKKWAGKEHKAYALALAELERLELAPRVRCVTVSGNVVRVAVPELLAWLRERANVMCLRGLSGPGVAKAFAKRSSKSAAVGR